ncbi:ATP-dependent Clp protease proteolytic subunit 4, chloroplastic [Olea europaea subsp. europaea]|uniref:ATP-dependent Clp protease proteolytic subunit 4, chloroplastic n=1 Tax=Olea europaea subsp. europaea TaxID=158383 RepID=A0A8S0RVN7_OLEEU|nr:ATP-dependent Clp protease proteolytic subunit 4, chloroplastic [Olea europaea subsp. europaea]
MDLLLKERIVFLGNQVDDFLADAIISQLLLLDAQDPLRIFDFSSISLVAPSVEYGIIDGVIFRDTIIPLVPVPEKVKASTFNYEEIGKDPKKFLTPEILDDEIY